MQKHLARNHNPAVCAQCSHEAYVKTKPTLFRKLVAIVIAAILIEIIVFSVMMVLHMKVG